MFRLAGHDVQAFDENQLADVRNLFIGFVFQQFNLLAYLPAWRNVELRSSTRACRPRERRDARAGRARHRSAWPTGPTTGPGELSGGQQQRVAIARALSPSRR